MSENKEEKQKVTLKRLKRIKVFTLEHLVSYLEGSIPTARLGLKSGRPIRVIIKMDDTTACKQFPDSMKTVYGIMVFAVDGSVTQTVGFGKSASTQMFGGASLGNVAK